MSRNTRGTHRTSYNAIQFYESEQGWYLFNAAWKNWRQMFMNMSGNSLLDLGCGSGIGLGLAKMFRPDLEATGVEEDISYHEVWKARGLNVVQGDIYSLEFEDSSYDTVWSSHVIEHLREPKKMIEESFRVSRQRVIHAVPVGNVEDKNLGTQHLEVYNRLNFRKLFEDFTNEIRLEYVEDPYMSSFIAIMENK